MGNLNRSSPIHHSIDCRSETEVQNQSKRKPFITAFHMGATCANKSKEQENTHTLRCRHTENRGFRHGVHRQCLNPGTGPSGD